MIKNKSDIIIVGSGLIGLFTAYFLAKLGLSVIIIDKKKIFTKDFIFKDVRTTAISEGTKIILENHGFWQKIHKYTQPIKYIKVFDRSENNKINFQNNNAKGFLGYIIENKFLKKNLLNQISKNNNIKILEDTDCNDLNTDDNFITITTSKNKYISSLLIACDGKHSDIRSIIKQPFFSKKYFQNALVLNFLHTKNHQNIAYEIFYDTGPLAILPMSKKDKKNYCSSLIWSHSPDFIKSLQDIDDDLFLTLLDEKIEHICGKAKKILDKQIFPLSAHINSSFISKRIIFAGDAAHSIHPIAGQGWNLGMRDVEALFNIISKAQSNGIDLGSDFVCKNYENERYYDSYSLYQITDKLNSIFLSENYGLRQVRNVGFHFINLKKSINKMISKYAMRID